MLFSLLFIFSSLVLVWCVCDFLLLLVHSKAHSLPSIWAEIEAIVTNEICDADINLVAKTCLPHFRFHTFHFLALFILSAAILFMHVDNHRIVQLSIFPTFSWRSICYFWLLLLCSISSSFMCFLFFSAAFQCCCVWVRFGMFMFACISHTMLNTNRQSKYNTFPWCCPNAMLSTTCTNIFVYVCVCVCDNSQLMTIINKTSKCVKGVSVRLVGVLRNRERKKPENKLDWCLMYAYFML